MTASFRLDFSNVEGQREIGPLPDGRYHVAVTGGTASKTSEQAQNPGVDMIQWEFTVVSGDKYVNRKVWDTTVFTENSLWKIKAMLDACGFDTDGELSFEIEDVIGQELEIQTGIKPKRKDEKTGKEYKAKNNVVGFYPHETSDADLLT